MIEKVFMSYKCRVLNSSTPLGQKDSALVCTEDSASLVVRFVKERKKKKVKWKGVMFFRELCNTLYAKKNSFRKLFWCDCFTNFSKTTAPQPLDNILRGAFGLVEAYLQ